MVNAKIRELELHLITIDNDDKLKYINDKFKESMKQRRAGFGGLLCGYCCDKCVIGSAEHGHLEVVKYLVNPGLIFMLIIMRLLVRSAENNHLDVINYLIEIGADMYIDENLIFKLKAQLGDLKYVQHFVENKYTY